jgi:hypothetical protein
MILNLLLSFPSPKADSKGMALAAEAKGKGGVRGGGLFMKHV